MTATVLDASALLSLLLGEPGAEEVRARRAEALISAVNYGEVLGRTAILCGSLADARRRVNRQEVTVVPFDRDQSIVAASLIPFARPLGLSMADRCCLALGLTRAAPILTADREWQKLSVGVEITLIR